MTPAIPEVEVPRLIRAYEAGHSTAELADRYDCNPRTIANTLRRNGIPLRQRGAVGAIEESPRLQKRVLVLRGRGLSYEAIAEQVPVGPHAVGRFLRTRGLGDPLKPVGERHGRWNGGRTRNGEGYVLVWVAPDHAFAEMRNKAGYILEHRLVMAEHLGRPLRRQETVHHINGNKADNRLNNLQLRQGKHGKHNRFRCRACGSLDVEPVNL